MTASVHVVSVGVGPFAAGDTEGGAVVAALASAGVPVAARVFIEEDDAALEHSLASDGGLTVIVAGAGGSAGDIVRRAIARAAGVRLALSERMLAALEEFYQHRDRPLPRRAERLALLPQGAVLCPMAGGEPAWILDTARAAFVVLPRGAHAGIEALIEQQVLPLARARLSRGAVMVRTLKTADASVSDVEDRLVDFLARDGDVSLLVVPAEAEVWVRLRARGATPAEASDGLAAAEAEVLAVLGDDCYGRDADTLERVVGTRLRARGLTLAVAESCTGGLLGHRLTSVAGSSAYFERGVIVYSNDAKMELLGVPESVLRAHGAVSGPAAEAMARGVCAMARTPCGLSITGIAGPEGGTPAKPVGTVFIGLAFDGEATARRFLFSGDRNAIKWQSSSMALDMLRRRLGGD
ncbi:MAG: nicotinamide-nucleotide amidohydrolase family protein [Candidatus Rokubacteria bacterium]|nr:nicotinamide-nucleotide amidohydrolase family protein [Candidatus Rokubacteria bacterium]